MNVAEVMPASCPGLHLVELHREATAFGPTQVHAQQHVGPVLRIGAPGTGMHLAHRVLLVVLTGEQCSQLELVELATQRRERIGDLAFDGVVGLLASELEERVGIVDTSCQRLPPLDVVDDARQFARHLACAVGIVPEIGSGRLGLELRAYLARARRFAGSRARRRVVAAATRGRRRSHAQRATTPRQRP